MHGKVRITRESEQQRNTRIGVGHAPRRHAPVVGIDHLVLSVGDFERSKEFYSKLLGFLGFKLKYDYADMAGWSNGKTLFWIAAADERGPEAQIPQRRYRLSPLCVRAVRAARTSMCSAPSSVANDMNVVDPPGEYYGRNYYAVYFTDPDGMKLEGMIWAPPQQPARRKAKRKTASVRK